MLDLQIGGLYINDDSVKGREGMLTEVLGKHSNLWYKARVIDPGTSETPNRKVDELFTFNYNSKQHEAMHPYVEENIEVEEIPEVELQPTNFNDLLGG